MSTVAQAAQAYREAIQKHRIAKAWLEANLKEAHASGRSVSDLAAESGYSRQRIYQLISTKEK